MRGMELLSFNSIHSDQYSGRICTRRFVKREIREGKRGHWK